jgi:hypothetical protein
LDRKKREIQVSSPKDNNVLLFDFFAFFTEAEPPPFWGFLDLALSSELIDFMTPSLNSSSFRLFDLMPGLDEPEEEKESPCEAEDFELGSFDED